MSPVFIHRANESRHADEKHLVDAHAAELIAKVDEPNPHLLRLVLARLREVGLARLGPRDRRVLVAAGYFEPEGAE